MKKIRFTLLLLSACVCSAVLSAQPVEIVSGNITQNTTWGPENIYLLTGYVYVKNQATLTIQPGTIIKGDKNSKGTLIVTRGAKIVADGKRSQPIVFTSNEANPAPGDWGGVVVCGYAPTNSKINGINCLGVAEGGINTPLNDAYFGGGDQPGGCQPADNSGILRFVRIEYGGIAFQFNNETNGLTLAGVGSGTTIDHVQVSHSGDDGFEFFGGTVNCKHLIAYANKDDDFDFDLGYQGQVQFALAVRDPALSDVSGSNGLEIDNDLSGTPTLPKTRPTLSNFTVIGPTGTMDENYRRTAHLRRNSEPGLFNSLFIGNFPVGIFIDGVSTIANAQNNQLEIKNCRVADAAELLKSTESSFNINQWFNNAAWGNAAVPNSSAFALAAPFNLGDPDAMPMPGSPVITGAAFTAPRVNTAFFEKVNYLGAFGALEDWSCGWARFEALNTNCTVDADEPYAVIAGLSLRPTVAQQEVQLFVQLRETADVSVEIYHLSGRYMGRPVDMPRVSGEQTWTISIGELPNGIYLLRIQAGGAIRTERVVVAR